MKTVIFPLLAIKASFSWLDWLENFGWLIILNNRNNLKARITAKTLAPAKKIDKYIGKMAMKSMMP